MTRLTGGQLDSYQGPLIPSWLVLMGNHWVLEGLVGVQYSRPTLFNHASLETLCLPRVAKPDRLYSGQ